MLHPKALLFGVIPRLIACDWIDCVFCFIRDNPGAAIPDPWASLACPYSGLLTHHIDDHDLEDDLDFDEEYISADCFQHDSQQRLRQWEISELITSSKFSDWVIQQRAQLAQSRTKTPISSRCNSVEACRQCQTHKEGCWIACDTKAHDGDQSTHWYHTSCVGLTSETIPEGKLHLQTSLQPLQHSSDHHL